MISGWDEPTKQEFIKYDTVRLQKKTHADNSLIKYTALMSLVCATRVCVKLLLLKDLIC